MSSVQDIVAEIGHASGYIATQTELELEDVDIGAMDTSLAAGISGRIGTLRVLRADGAQQIIAALRDSGFSVASRTTIANAIRNRYEATDGDGKPSCSKLQTLVCID